MEFPHNYAELINYLFYAAAALIGTSIRKEISSLRKSAESLNMKMGVMIEKSNWHDREIQRLDRQKVDKKNE